MRPPLIEEITGKRKVGGNKRKQTQTAEDEPQDGDGCYTVMEKKY